MTAAVDELLYVVQGPARLLDDSGGPVKNVISEAKQRLVLRSSPNGNVNVLPLQNS